MKTESLLKSHATNTYGGIRGIAPRILNRDTKWRRVVTFTPRPLCPQGKRLGGPHSRSGRGGEEKNSHPLLGIEPPIVKPVAQRYTTELSRLLVVQE
jgi:hypothetical protein